MENHWYYLTDAAKESHYPAYSTLRKAIADGRLPAIKQRGRIKVRERDLNALIEPTPVDPTPSHKNVDSAVERVVSNAPRLSPSQRERLAVILNRNSVPGNVGDAR